MRGRCVPHDRHYADILVHLERDHPELTGGGRFARHDDDTPVVIAGSDTAHVKVLDLNRLAELATAALPYWQGITSVTLRHDVDHVDMDGVVIEMLMELDPATVLLLVNLASAGVP